jgi:hypothetical protein
MTALHQQGSPSLQADIGERATEPTERPAICWVAASICRMARDPIARPGMRTLALICELLPRRRPAPVMAAPAHPRRSDRRVWAGQCPMASCGAVSMAAKRSGGCWGLIQINAATRLPPKSGSWHQDGFPKSKLPRSPLSFSAWLCSPSSCCPLDERGLRRTSRSLATA